MSVNPNDRIGVEYAEWREKNVVGFLDEMNEQRIYAAFLAGYGFGIGEAKRIVAETFKEARR